MIVLDTHAWIWWLSNPELLPGKTKDIIDQAAADGNVFISSISAWEAAMLVSRGRLQLTMDVSDWIATSESLPFIHFVPVNNKIAIQSVQLPGDLHDDPADRIIIATALSLGATLVTKDEKIRNYPHVKTVWE